MNSIPSLLVLCCLILPVTACTRFSGASVNSQTGLSGTRQPKPDPFTAGDSSAGSISPPAPAFTAFGNKPAFWSAVIDGPLLQIERSATDLVTLTAERFNDNGSIRFVATDHSAKQQHRRRRNNVNLTINRKPCISTRGTYDLSAILFYKNRKYTGCAVAGAPVTEH
ncbi:hypothetical protein ACVFVO_17545 [Advenella kashmirensis]